MSPNLNTYFLHSLNGSFFGFLSLMPFLKATALVNSFNSKGIISQILGRKHEILSLLWKTDLTFDIANSELIRKLKFASGRWKMSLKMEGDTFRYTWDIFVANICRFLVCIVTDFSFSTSFSKDDNLSTFNRRKHLHCRKLIFLFINTTWNIQIVLGKNFEAEAGKCAR